MFFLFNHDDGTSRHRKKDKSIDARRSGSSCFWRDRTLDRGFQGSQKSFRFIAHRDAGPGNRLMIICPNAKDRHEASFLPYLVNKKALLAFWNSVAKKCYVNRIGMYQIFGFVQGKGFLHGISRIEQKQSA